MTKKIIIPMLLWVLVFSNTSLATEKTDNRTPGEIAYENDPRFLEQRKDQMALDALYAQYRFGEISRETFQVELLRMGADEADIALMTTRTVSVLPPDIDFYLNGVHVPIEEHRYPLFFYHDIIYLPLSWGYCQALGLSAAFSPEQGLHISSGEAVGIDPFLLEIAEHALARGSEIALDLVPFPVALNGNSVHETWEWPILLYDNIVYLPLIWDNISNLQLDFSFLTTPTSSAFYLGH